MWIDASAGVAGDMLLAALHDAGAGLEAIRAAVEAVVPGSVGIEMRAVTRAGLRAVKADVRPLTDDPPHRTWRSIRELLATADLRPGVRERALAVFERLAAAEATVHGVAAEDVHFHEVGALDSIADVVGVCAALDDLNVGTVSAGEIALGSGRVRTAHGELPVPAPAVAELARGWRVRAGGPGELATPTGLAVIRALADTCEDLPTMTLEATGVGAGGRDTPNRPNVVRAFLSAPRELAPPPAAGAGGGPGAARAPGPSPAGAAAGASGATGPSPAGGAPVAGRAVGPSPAGGAPVAGRSVGPSPAGGAGGVTPAEGLAEAVLLEANVDDLDPRLWPGVLHGLLADGASDAWLVPILMKKGRPAHTLSVLCEPAAVATLRARIFRDTSTLGVRESARGKTALPRTFVNVALGGGTVAIKIGHLNGAIVQVMPEFADVAALAARQDRPERAVLQEALAAAATAGLAIGATLPAPAEAEAPLPQPAADRLTTTPPPPARGPSPQSGGPTAE
ncbi:nickel pincer cofactor biosynthesis protein LarC [Actinoplanes sp. NPDC049596]|uniref:nickel pincer cofactor biosynthesis protein LarC n=1 Tax=unclassified Actinoplanes TaxID=2626549 RepID=UPI003448FD9E